MNLAMVSGTMGPIRDKDIFIRNDGATVVDGYIEKTFMKGEQEIRSHYYFTVSGGKADNLLKYYRPGDRVMLTGKLATRVDEDGHFWVTIVASSFSKMDTIDTDI